MMTGRPLPPAHPRIRVPRAEDDVPGIDVAGTVVAVGSAVSRFAVGDQVYGMCRGAFAEYAAALEKTLAHKPYCSTCQFEQAAVVPISAGPALQALCDARGGWSAARRC